MIYYGNVIKYCKDYQKIENYDKAIADTTQTWHLHHRTAIWWNCTKQDLIDNDCYYNRKACELIFLTKSEHSRVHKHGELNSMYGKQHTDESKRKMSEAKKGRVSPRKGISLSEETRRKISESMKGKQHTNESKRKMCEAKKGENNPFFGQHHSEETRRKISEAAKRRWSLQNKI